MRRKKCIIKECKEPWTVRVKVEIGDTLGAGTMRGEFCTKHAKQSISRYGDHLKITMNHFIKRALA